MTNRVIIWLQHSKALRATHHPTTAMRNVASTSMTASAKHCTCSRSGIGVLVWSPEMNLVHASQFVPSMVIAQRRSQKNLGPSRRLADRLCAGHDALEPFETFLQCSDFVTQALGLHESFCDVAQDSGHTDHLTFAIAERENTKFN